MELPTQPPPVNPYPKVDFQNIAGAVSSHRDMTATPAFERGIRFALLQYQRMLTESAPPDMTASAAAFLKIQGAQEFVNVLRSLGESGRTITRIEERNLNHKA